MLFTLRYIHSYTTIFDGRAFHTLIQIIHTQDILIYICTKIKIDKIGKMIKYRLVDISISEKDRTRHVSLMTAALGW